MATQQQLSQLGGALNTLGSTNLSGASEAQRAQLSSTLAGISRTLSGMQSSTTTASSGGGITSDSRNAVNAERTIETNIRDLRDRSGLGGSVDNFIDPLYNLQRQQEQEIQRQRQLLDQRRRDEVAGIQEGFGVVKTDTELAQRRETGATSMDLARAGGYLGVTASQSGVLQNLAVIQRQEMLALEAKKNEAIRAANNAYEDRDFELARELLESARDLEKQVFDRRNTFLDQQLKLMGEERAQKSELRLTQQFKYQMANDRIDRLMSVGADPGAEDIFRLSQELGVSPNEIQRIVTAAKNTKELEEKQSKTRMDLALASAINQTPRDSFITIDGVTYRGNGLLPQSGGSSAAERRAQEERDTWFQFMADVRGNEAQGIAPMPFDEAIKTYPDLGTKAISDFYANLRSFENQEVLNKNLDTGKWDVFVPFNNSGAAMTPIVYDREKWEQAVIERSQRDTSGWFLGKIKGSDDTKMPIDIGGRTYWINGVKSGTEVVAPTGLRQRDFVVPGQAVVDRPSISAER